MKNYSKYTVDFNIIWDPNKADEITPIRSVQVELYAENLKEAIECAWSSVTVSPKEYEIVSISKEGWPCSRGSIRAANRW